MIALFVPPKLAFLIQSNRTGCITTHHELEVLVGMMPKLLHFILQLENDIQNYFGEVGVGTMQRGVEWHVPHR